MPTRFKCHACRVGKHGIHSAREEEEEEEEGGGGRGVLTIVTYPQGKSMTRAVPWCAIVHRDQASHLE